MSQVELENLVGVDGVAKSIVGQIERCEKELQRAPREALARHLRVPERWFVAEDPDEVAGLLDAEPSRDELSRRLGNLETLVQDLHRELLVRELEESPRSDEDDLPEVDAQ